MQSSRRCWVALTLVLGLALSLDRGRASEDVPSATMAGEAQLAADTMESVQSVQEGGESGGADLHLAAASMEEDGRLQEEIRGREEESANENLVGGRKEGREEGEDGGLGGKRGGGEAIAAFSEGRGGGGGGVTGRLTSDLSPEDIDAWEEQMRFLQNAAEAYRGRIAEDFAREFPGNSAPEPETRDRKSVV